MRIFLVVGTQFPFDRLVKLIDHWAAGKKHIQITGQIGYGKYKPETFSGIPYIKGDGV